MSSGISGKPSWSRCARSAERRAQEERGRNGKIPRESRPTGRTPAQEAARRLVAGRIARQKEIDASIAAKAEFEYLYDKPYEDKKKSPRRRALHRREPQPAPRAGRG